MASTSPAKRTKKNLASAVSGPGGPWSRKTPHRVRTSYHGHADPHGWALWQKHLAKRKLKPLAKLFKGRQSPLLWAWPPGSAPEQAERVIELARLPRLADRKSAELDTAVLCWLSRAEVTEPDASFALECLAWAGALPELAADLSERPWWQLCNRLFAIAAAETHGNDPLVAHLLHGELPAVLAYVLPELALSRSLLEVSRRTLDPSVALEGEALLHGSRLDALRPLLACWTRWRVVSLELDDTAWVDRAPRRYARLVELALRLARPDGTQVFASPQASAWDRRLVKIAVRLANHPKTKRVAGLIATGGRVRTKHAASPSVHIESAGLAVLRCNWRPQSPQLAVNYSGAQLMTELSLGTRCLWSGPTEIEVRVDGKRLPPRQPWDLVCWESDREVDYLELELELADDVRVQRHLALTRRAGFLFMADAVLGTVPRKIEYRATLPLGDHTQFQPADETREGMLQQHQRPLSRVLPLALSEWRAGNSSGTLTARDGALTLAQSSFGTSLLAPLFFDFEPRRLSKELTWRQLTVGEERQVVPRDSAVGYRVQVGDAQWLIYRSLSAPEVRTVLGQNLKNEFLIARFRTTGKIKTLLEIEA